MKREFLNTSFKRGKPEFSIDKSFLQPDFGSMLRCESIVDNSFLNIMSQNSRVKQEKPLFDDNFPLLDPISSRHVTDSPLVIRPSVAPRPLQPCKPKKKISKKKKKRGKYRICTMNIKKEAIRIARIKSIKEASDIMNIPEKNIKRWMKNGPERKKGAGRKTLDPQMESKLLEWIANDYKKLGEFPDNKDIKLQAKFFSISPQFKASKGWCDKFLRRNQKFFEFLKS